MGTDWKGVEQGVNLSGRIATGKGPYLLEVWKPTGKHLMSKAELVAAVQKALGKEASSAQAERTVDAVIEGTNRR
jgi:hypothetical protein